MHCRQKMLNEQQMIEEMERLKLEEEMMKQEQEKKKLEEVCCGERNRLAYMYMACLLKLQYLSSTILSYNNNLTETTIYQCTVALILHMV